MLAEFDLFIILAGIVLAYVSDGRRWAQGQCDMTFSAQTWPPSWLTPSRTAMAEWSQAGANFQFVETPNSRNGLHAFDMGTWGQRLALTWTSPSQPNSHIQDVQTLVNSYWVFDVQDPRAVGRDPSGDVFSIETVVKHELGHALFLGDHGSDPHSIMHFPIAANQPAKSLGTDDVNGIRNLYP